MKDYEPMLIHNSVVRGYDSLETGKDAVYYGLVFKRPPLKNLTEAEVGTMLDKEQTAIDKMIDTICRERNWQVGQRLELHEVYDPETEGSIALWRVPFRDEGKL